MTFGDEEVRLEVLGVAGFTQTKGGFDLDQGEMVAVEKIRAPR